MFEKEKLFNWQLSRLTDTNMYREYEGTQYEAESILIVLTRLQVSVSC